MVLVDDYHPQIFVDRCEPSCRPRCKEEWARKDSGKASRWSSDQNGYVLKTGIDPVKNMKQKPSWKYMEPIYRDVHFDLLRTLILIFALTLWIFCAVISMLDGRMIFDFAVVGVPSEVPIV